MKTALLAALSAAMLAGVIFGAPMGDRVVENREVQPGSLREAPIPAREQLSARADELVQGARNAYWQGDYKLAAQYYLMVIKSGRGSCNDQYNLACCYGRLGDAKQAVKFLTRSVEAGFTDTELIRKDPDFQGIKDVPQFREAVEKLARVISLRSKKNNADSGVRELTVREPRSEARAAVNSANVPGTVGLGQR